MLVLAGASIDLIKSLITSLPKLLEIACPEETAKADYITVIIFRKE
jgi:hypothetical protein